jgi:hypothetical protein
MVNALVAIIGRQNIRQPIIYWRRLMSKVENPISFSYLLPTSVGICKLQSHANYGFNYQNIQLLSRTSQSLAKGACMSFSLSSGFFQQKVLKLNKEYSL